ncbi:MAG: hypothetical protein OHK0038_04840 [Flammeovirgaceae bacterium]
MEIDALLLKILHAQKPLEVFSRTEYKKQYVQYLKILHPDVCSHPKANEVVTKLNLFKTQIEDLCRMEDDAGIFRQLDDKVLMFMGDKALLHRSYECYLKLMRLNDDASNHFKKYLPQRMEFKGDSLYVYTSHRVVPFLNLNLPQQHVAWMTSRMLEFISWMHQVDFCHAGINPASLCVVPETHGIICTSFYHQTYMNSKIQTISGKYLNWYPSIVFSEKRAIPYIDIALVQRTALYLLGDESGNGIKLKKTNNEMLIDFLITPHYQAFETFDNYRKLLAKIFGKPTYFPLEI